VQKADTFIASGITPSPYILDCIALPPLLESPLPLLFIMVGQGQEKNEKPIKTDRQDRKDRKELLLDLL
jgi:hypothetical protein